jgi:hypothetical protein
MEALDSQDEELQASIQSQSNSQEDLQMEDI